MGSIRDFLNRIDERYTHLFSSGNMIAGTVVVSLAVIGIEMILV